MVWKKESKKQSSGTRSSSDAVFAKVILSEDDKEAFTSWQNRHLPDTEDVLTEFCKLGYRVTLKYDTNNRCFQSAITQQFDDHIHGGVIVTSRAGDAHTALWLGLYKVLELYWEAEFPTNDNLTLWG